MSKDLMGLMAAGSSDVSLHVGMDEVVNVFVSRYEDQLFAEKDRLSKEIKMLKQTQSNLLAKVNEEFDTSQYNRTVPELNLITTVEKVVVCMEGDGNADYNVRGRKNLPVHFIQVNVKFTIEGTEKTTAYYVHAVDESVVREYESNKAELTNLSTELNEVLMKIKNVGRKERQIRGKISEIKLEQSGYAELVNSPELLQLIEM